MCHFMVCCVQQVGKEFDALIIDTKAPLGDPVFDIFDSDTIEVSVWSTCVVHYFTATSLTFKGFGIKIYLPW